MRVHKLQNVQNCLDYLTTKRKVRSICGLAGLHLGRGDLQLHLGGGVGKGDLQLHLRVGGVEGALWRGGGGERPSAALKRGSG